MESSSLMLLCVLLTCSVWMVQGKCVAIDGLQDQNEVEVLAEAKIPGVCWACKWALNKVKKEIGKNATVEKIKSKLMSVCDKIGLLKSKCKKFTLGHLGLLVEELTTTDDVRTICVKAKACKSEFLMMEERYPEYTEEVFSGNDNFD
ncbi:NK-lysin tandem duplicate 4 [Eucyclogobius newberryi]|uniref:NK-lysin tandem duplicate 4 n=1 Tax=Eucyclogobius newberryi TaxID=166745 RepID=UPI003B597156